MLDENINNITKDMYMYKKFVKIINKKYYKIPNERLHEVIIETLTILNVINFQFNTIFYKKRYITQFERMLSEEDIKKIIKTIYNSPDISFDELINQVNIESEYLSYLLERLINVDMILEFNNYYEISCKLSEYIKSKGDCF